MVSKYNTSRMLPKPKQWHLIDYVIVRRRDIRDVRITRAMQGAECWTDHRLIRSIFSLHITPVHRKKPKLVRAKFNVTTLDNPTEENFRELWEQGYRYIVVEITFTKRLKKLYDLAIFSFS